MYNQWVHLKHFRNEISCWPHRHWRRGRGRKCIVRAYHFSYSFFLFDIRIFFFCSSLPCRPSLAVLSCIVSLCIARWLEEKSKKGIKITYLPFFIDKSAFYMCTSSSSTRPSIQVTRVRVFLIFLRHADTTIGGLLPHRRAHKHPQHTHTGHEPYYVERGEKYLSLHFPVQLRTLRSSFQYRIVRFDIYFFCRRRALVIVFDVRRSLVDMVLCMRMLVCVCASIGQQYESISCNKAICSRSSDLSSSIMSK